LDPGFAPAYVGLAGVEFNIGSGETAMAYAHKALELDPTQAEAHVLLATIKMIDQWDWKGAREELRLAESIQPNMPNTRAGKGRLLMIEGKVDEGIASYRTALALNPYSHINACAMVGRYVKARHYDRAVEYGTDVAANFPHCPWEHQYVGEAYMFKGMYGDAIEHIEMSYAIYENPSSLASLGCAYALSGNTGEANKVLTRVIEESADAYDIARLQVALGNHEAALDWLEEAFSRHSRSLIWLNLDAMFDDIRDEPRFVKLVEDVGLPAG
ncbi:MAG: hypothetical protein IH969_07215, partial [Candidatus Krumholzibacteriota bacterium]|nr:hypothetical protein [Candidatus Krumholzibacteriota bacterium]